MGVCDRCDEKGPVYECWVEGSIEMLCESCSLEQETYDNQDDDAGWLVSDDELF